MNVAKSVAKLLLGAAFAFSANVMAVVPFQFDPDGTGGGGAITVTSLDWVQGNSVSIAGNPAGGLAVGNSMLMLTHSSLNSFVNGSTNIPVPAGTEFTFVMGVPVTVVALIPPNPNSAVYTFNGGGGNTNFVEMWVSAPDSNMLSGTGFNNTKRILYGTITDGSGSLVVSACPGGATTQFDQFPSLADNDYPGVTTVCGTGSNQVSVNVLWVDPDYFPGFGPDQIDSLKSFFNTSNITPFNQQNPSHQFVENGSGFDGTTAEATTNPILGPVNGGLQNVETRDYQNQADANQSFEPAVTVEGTCRVTYGGNDKNGNISPNSFGSACMKVKGNQENCYTFGGQVGAPTADPAQGGPFGEHTHHQVSGPAGDFVFRAGTNSAPKDTRIDAVACKDPGGCRQAVAQASFKQIDFEGTGSFRTLDAVATAYLSGKAGHPVLPDNADDQIYYFRVDMDDTGEPGNKPSKNRFDVQGCTQFFNADLNVALGIADPILTDYAACNACADVYQFYICKDENPCEQADAIYAVRAYLTGGNIQLHKVVK